MPEAGQIGPGVDRIFGVRSGRSRGRGGSSPPGVSKFAWRRILLVVGVGDIGDGVAPFALAGLDRGERLVVDRGDELALAQILHRRAREFGGDAIEDAVAHAAAFQPQHEPRRLGRAAIDFAAHAIAPVIADQRRGLARSGRESRGSRSASHRRTPRSRAPPSMARAGAIASVGIPSRANRAVLSHRRVAAMKDRTAEVANSSRRSAARKPAPSPPPVAPAEVRRRRLLPHVDDAAPDRPRAGEQVEQPCRRRRAGSCAASAVRSSVKRPSISSTASLLCRNTSRHMVGSEAAMRVKSRKPPAENFSTSERSESSSSAAVPTML